MAEKIIPKTTPPKTEKELLKDQISILLTDFRWGLPLFGYPLNAVGGLTLPPGATVQVVGTVPDDWNYFFLIGYHDVSLTGVIWLAWMADDDVWTGLGYYITGSIVNTPITFPIPIFVADRCVWEFTNTAAVPVSVYFTLFGYQIREEHFTEIINLYKKYLGIVPPIARRSLK